MNEVKIQIPDGYRISVEQSNFQEGHIVFEKAPAGSLASFPIPSRYCVNPIMETRTGGPYAGRALFLEGRYDWELIDEEGLLGKLLIARLKKEEDE